MCCLGKGCPSTHQLHLPSCQGYFHVFTLCCVPGLAPTLEKPMLSLEYITLSLSYLFPPLLQYLLIKHVFTSKKQKNKTLLYFIPESIQSSVEKKTGHKNIVDRILRLSYILGGTITLKVNATLSII